MSDLVDVQDAKQELEVKASSYRKRHKSKIRNMSQEFERIQSESEDSDVVFKYV